MNLFEAIECVYEGYSVRHAQWDPGTSLTLWEGCVVLREESLHVINMTPLSELHTRITSYQLVSTDWCVVTPDAQVNRTRRAQRQADVESLLQQLRSNPIHWCKYSDAFVTKARNVGTSTERLEKTLEQVQQEAKVAEVEALIQRMQEADTRTILEGVSRIRRRAHMSGMPPHSVAFHVDEQGHVSAYPPPTQRRGGNGDIVYGPGGTQRMRVEQAGEDVLDTTSARVADALGHSAMRQVLDNLHVGVPQRNARTTVTHLDAETKARLKRRLHSTLGLIDGLEYKAPEQYPSEIQRIADAVEQLLKDLKL